MTAMTPASTDLATQALARLVATLAEDAIFVFAATSASEAREALDGLVKRRAEAYAALIQGTAAPWPASAPRMGEDFDGWLVAMVRAIAPVAPPSWMPMSGVLAEKVTLEVGARGLRSLFSSKPSEKDVLRVKRLGTLAVRVLRAVLAADGTLDAEEARTLGALVGALGLPAEDVTTLHREALADVKDLEVYGEIEPAVARGVLRGAWLAAAWDGIDPREEEVIRIVATKLSIDTADVEATRADVIKQVEARHAAGVAVVDGVRYVLSDRVPGAGVLLAASAGTLMIPRRYRDEALAQVGHGAPITLAKRHSALSAEARQTALAITWCAALYDDPSVARRALLRARFDRVAHDLGDDGTRARVLIDEWLGDAIAAFAVNLK